MSVCPTTVYITIDVHRTTCTGCTNSIHLVHQNFWEQAPSDWAVWMTKYGAMVLVLLSGKVATLKGKLLNPGVLLYISTIVLVHFYKAENFDIIYENLGEKHENNSIICCSFSSCTCTRHVFRNILVCYFHHQYDSLISNFMPAFRGANRVQFVDWFQLNLWKPV